jgi:aspartate 1-decarboxylase
MQRQMLKSKIHRATVTACDPDYSPVVVHVDERNRIVAVDSDPEVLLSEVSS